jgi:hypothetical protein
MKHTYKLNPLKTTFGFMVLEVIIFIILFYMLNNSIREIISYFGFGICIFSLLSLLISNKSYFLTIFFISLPISFFYFIELLLIFLIIMIIVFLLSIFIRSK